MSILGITALNDIVVRHRVSKPNDILKFLRQSFVEALSQNDPDQIHKDGMDIGICVFNSKSRELQFAGAGISLWVVSSEKNESNPDGINNNVLAEYKGDNLPVGQSHVMKSFKNTSLSLSGSKAKIYIATDGFAHQFGGDKKQKYSSSRLKKLIVENSEKPMKLQLEVLMAEFEEWKGEGYQLDDVTVMGISL